LGTSALATAVTSFGAVLGDSQPPRTLADHEPTDVLQEDQRDATLAGELDEVGALAADWLNRMPSLARMATGTRRRAPKPQDECSRHTMA